MDLTSSFANAVPSALLQRYEWREVRNAAAIVKATNSNEWDDIIKVLTDFRLTVDELVMAGGNKSDLTGRLETSFKDRDWRESRLDTEITLTTERRPYRAGGEKKSTIESSSVTNQGYLVDGMKGRIALDVEWNAKDGNLGRDIGTYRAMYEAGFIDAGVIVTRTQEDLRELAEFVDPGTTKFGTTTTTNLTKLEPRLTRGDAGGCPILAIAICSRSIQVTRASMWLVCWHKQRAVP